MADTYRVIRSTTIAATPEQIYPHLVDFHRWQAWSPWEGLDPDQHRTYSGPAAGTGARYAWRGNKKVGEGSMEILSSEPPHSVVVDLRFIKPFRSQATTSFEVAADGAGATVTWMMEGAQTMATRVMGIFKSMDAMIGPDFERGLAGLKATVEGG